MAEEDREKIRALVIQVMADVMSVEAAVATCTPEEEALFLIELGRAKKRLAHEIWRRGWAE